MGTYLVRDTCTHGREDLVDAAITSNAEDEELVTSPVCC